MINDLILSKYNNVLIFSDIEDVVVFLAIPKVQKYVFFQINIYPSVNINSVIAFPSVKVNVGGGYDNTSGVFTCPSEGYYVLHWNVMSVSNEQPCSSAILKNGVEIIGNAIGGNLGPFHLNKNDRTWIKATSACKINAEHSSFSGFKIK